MYSDAATSKFKSKESELAKKICSFLDYFFFNRSLKLVHLQMRLLGQDDLSVAYLYLLKI